MGKGGRDMRATRLAMAWLCVVALLGATHTTRGQETVAPDEAGGPALGEPAPAVGDQVQMVEIAVGDHTVRGRLLGETESAITIEGPAGGAVAYPRGAVRVARRFTIAASAYHEERGDLHRERAWTAEEASAEFQRARLAYQRALAAAASDEDSARLATKLRAAVADREEWQREALEQENLVKARHEAELARLEAELSRARLDALKEQANEILALRTDLRRARQEIRFLADRTERLERKVDSLEGDLEDVTRGGRLFATVNMHEDLERAVSMLRRKVDRLESRVGR